MSIQILDTIDEEITVQVTGKIDPTELAAGQAEMLQQLRDLGDLSFQGDADPLIQKMAIIGEAQSKDMSLMFTSKGLRPLPIELFPTGHLREANAWLKA